MTFRSGSDPQHHDAPTVVVEVEVPRLGFVKRCDDGSVDFVSPLPCPFNYGAVPGSLAPDGDRLDAVLLGPRLGRGLRVQARVYGVVHFVDAGCDDPKLIAGHRPPTRGQLAQVKAFFAAYARAKGALNLARRKSGRTFVRSVQLPMVQGQLEQWLP